MFMNFRKYLKISSEEISQKLEYFFSQWDSYIQKSTPQITHLNHLFIDRVSGGKMIRGALVKLGYELVTQEPNKEILKTSCAFEILHSALLIHDDLIDKSDIRRGKSTIHTILGNNHYGTSQALTLGDMGFFLAIKLIAESNFPADAKNRAISFFSDAVNNTIQGQMLDVEIPHRKTPPRKEDVLTIQKLKSAYYSIVAPLSIGALLGGAKSQLLRDLKEFGENAGIAFQIQDDILGIFGDEKKIGKSVTSDIEEGKNTLLIFFASNNANPKQKIYLHKYYGTGKIKSRYYKLVKEIFVDTGALSYAYSQAFFYMNQAKKVIRQITQDSRKSVLLHSLVDYLVNRSA